MALSQKQLFNVSQLYMATSKAGLGFDLSRFVGDANYANETLVSLVASAQEPALQAMVAQTILQFMPAQEAPTPAVLAAPPAPSVMKPAAPSTKDESRYIGRLR